MNRRICLAFLCLLVMAGAAYGQLSGRVVGVSDGDTITVLDAKGKPVAGPLAVTLAPGEEKVARAGATLLGRYCKFVVPAPKSDYRGSVLVFKDGVGAISALPAN